MRIQSTYVIALVLLGAAAPLEAQSAKPAQLGMQFVGCWNVPDGRAQRSRTCIVPGEGTLRIITLGGENGTTESTLRLDGEKTPVNENGCEGFEVARFSQDGERLVIDGEIACGGNPKQKVETGFTVSPNGNLVQTSGAGMAMIPSAAMRVMTPVEAYIDIPIDTRTQVLPHLAEAEAARLALRDNQISARDVLELERMGVAAPLIDVFVAASYPESFQIDATGGMMPVQGNASGEYRDQPRNAPITSDPFLFMNGYPMMSMYDWELMYRCNVSGLGCASLYNRYAIYGGGYGYGYGYGGFGWGWPGYGYPVVVRPVVTIPGGTGGRPSGGRAVNGRGYTQTAGSAGSGTAQPRNNGSTVRSSGSSNASSTSSSSGGSSGGGSARTAKPRSP